MGVESFRDRQLSYRVSAVLTLLFSVLLALGVACPYWYLSGDGNSYGGLWSRCDSSAGTCTSLTADETEDWWLALQVLEPLALFLVCLSCGAILFENCFSGVNAPVLTGEGPGLLGGMLGLTGCIVFIAKAGTSHADKYTTFSWAFYFAIFGSVVVFAASIVILVAGKTRQKSLRLHHPAANVSPEPVRRFSQLWATDSPSTPVGARRAVSATSSRSPSPLPPGTPPPELRPISPSALTTTVNLSEEI